MKKSLLEALKQEKPLQIAGTINAYCALLARTAGFKAIYLSGSGVASASFGLPDLGITTLNDVLEDARRITAACDLPLLVDIDTGFGGAFSIARTIKSMIRADVAAVHLEDQVQSKRCGHRPGKALVTTEEMCDRIKAAVDARDDDRFVIMARTDAVASEGIDKAIERALAYIDVGADMIFAEALTSKAEFEKFAGSVNVPVLANMTEFGKTPLLSKEELYQAGIKMILYPLSAFRAMSKAALNLYQTIRESGTQNNLLAQMQTREELYKILDYYQYEEKLNELYAKGDKK